MNTKTNNDQHLENMLTIKTTVETCMDIQYTSCGVGEGIDMSEQKQRFKHALDVLLDGVSLSTSESKRGKVGVYILGLLIKDNPDLVDASDVKAIQSIIEIADEQESPAFRL
ncbi:hypothetical protein MEG05_20565 [Vibrio aestuarianus]|uniref:hypothetical protein n=1 Tax=Vibrio aestuarianus TaxID=28171 RepID=UPI00237D0E5B|nr:hypothetical protein [Vibrio aestuarianus]MDE1316333.1 hypothetical protein [Vibrio aestuarianus]